MNIMDLKSIYDRLMVGDISVLTPEINNRISEWAVSLIYLTPEWSKVNIETADLILRIGNITYNNTSMEVLPLDDGLYDQLLVIYKKYNPNYQVGATPIVFKETPQNDFTETKVMAIGVSNKEMDSKLYTKTILDQHLSQYNYLRTMAFVDHGPIKKRLVNTPHIYPELVGTLDKCKFVLNNDAIELGVFQSPSVQVFERDFIQQHLKTGIIQPNEVFQMVAELKYDGVSVEANVCGDKIISALSRGDTSENIATDLTPIFGGYRFPYAKSVPTDVTFGMKFEAVITKYHLEQMSEARQKSYKNGRNAIIGLLGSTDADRFIDYITLIPLATSLDMERVNELEFLNKYYNSNQYNRYAILEGNYQQILFQVKQFTESAELIRKALPYMIDGVVISYIDPDKIEKLGRTNSVNKYSMAIKFNPKKVRTQFLGYTYSIGKSGEVIPMAHFKPCEFIGTIHDKQTIHSYNRFNELQLHKGDQIDVEYRNEVISYITKPDTEYNRNTKEPLELFISHCPYCDSKIKISESGKSAYCMNPECPERNVMRMTDMIDRLGFVDFAEESVRLLNIRSLKDLLNLTEAQCGDLGLGPIEALKFSQQVNQIKERPIYDYRIMSALGFDSMADEKWKVILSELSIPEIKDMNASDLYERLTQIPSIGPKIAGIITTNRALHMDDLNIICEMKNVISSKGLLKGKRIVISGFRNEAFIKTLIDNGYDASDSYSLTKDTFCLITNNPNSTSGKVTKAKKYGIPIMSIAEFVEAYNIKL